MGKNHPLFLTTPPFFCYGVYMNNLEHYVAVNAERIDYPEAQALMQHVHHDWIIHDVYRTPIKPQDTDDRHVIATNGNIPHFALFMVANVQQKDTVAYGATLILLGAYETEELAQANAYNVLHHFAHKPSSLHAIELLQDTGIHQKHVLPKNIQSVQSVHIQEINTLHCNRTNAITMDEPRLCL